MRKVLLLLAMVLTMGATMFALEQKDVQGKWKSSAFRQDLSEQGMPIMVDLVAELNLKADNTADFVFDMTQKITLDDPVRVNMFVRFNGMADYTVDGDSIVVTPRVDTMEWKFTEDDVKVFGVPDMNTASAMEAQLYQQFSLSMLDLVNEMGEPMTFNNVVLGDKNKKFDCTLDGAKGTFKKKK